MRNDMLPSHHRALVRDGHRLPVETLVPTLAPGPEDVLVRVRAAGVCGTDLQILRGLRNDPADILGHEALGEVITAGAWEDGPRPGDTVAFNPTHPGDPGRLLGHTLPGVFQQYVRVPRADVEAGMLVPVEAGLDPRLGALAEPLSAVLYSGELLRQAVLPESVALFGAGTVGLLHLVCLRRAGVRRVFLVHPREERLAWLVSRGQVAPAEAVSALDAPAEHLLRETGGVGVDAAVICTPRTGSLAALGEAVRAVRPGGCIDLLGGFPADAGLEALPGVDLAEIRRANECGQPSPGRLFPVRTAKERPLVLTGHRGAAARHLREAVSLLRSAPGAFAWLVTHVVSPDVAARALRLHAGTGAHRFEGEEWLKMVIDFERGAGFLARSPLGAGGGA
ncbi:alcohol dehydrogenase catalytic domain-containing protein [Archangium violaceum]|uniref:zinc-dependent alcohol dehydrogenase n=1 Tax=Archangium violaceum TaxID=83451 RepID=UPI00193BA3FD|nr:alcohol dehydrogenase catalytic domain-containing protein [Archangium violaceum]QRK10073.1 alcohol dehydrogenase catalytic domain-containing protein [Archangium violaceum]